MRRYCNNPFIHSNKIKINSLSCEYGSMRGVDNFANRSFVTITIEATDRINVYKIESARCGDKTNRTSVTQQEIDGSFLPPRLTIIS